MINSKILFLHDTCAMKIICNDLSMYKVAQQGMFDGLTSSIYGKIQSEVKNTKDPVASVINFIVPGVLWMFGFRKFSFLYSVLEAFGFDTAKFWSELKDKVETFLDSSDPNEEKSYSELNSIVQTVANNAIKAPDVAKIKEYADGGDLNNLDDFNIHTKANSMANIKFMTKSARPPFRRSKGPGILKMIEEAFEGRSGRGTGIRTGLTGFFTKIIVWLLGVMIVSAGFKIAGVTVGEIGKRLLGREDESGESDKSDNVPGDNEEKEDNQLKQTTRPPFVLKLNTNAPAHLFNTTYNDSSHVWMITLNINNIENILISWTQQLYPELNDRSAFTSSKDFTNVINKFKLRNPNPKLDIIAVPENLECNSIKMIIDQFANDVAAHTQNLQQTQPTINSIYA